MEIKSNRPLIINIFKDTKLHLVLKISFFQKINLTTQISTKSSASILSTTLIQFIKNFQNYQKTFLFVDIVKNLFQLHRNY